MLDAVGGFVKREEYLPYGETSYGGYARKRYRFTGKERDDESGFSYHGRRYYAAWIGRWISADPKGLVDGTNLYGYAHYAPLTAVDPTGTTAVTPDPNLELIQQSALRQPVTARASTSGIQQWLRDAYQALADDWMYGKVDVGHTEPYALTPPGKTVDTFVQLASENRSAGATTDKAAVAAARARGQPTRVGGKWTGPPGPKTRGQPPPKPKLQGLTRRAPKPVAQKPTLGPEPSNSLKPAENGLQREFDFSKPLATEAASIEHEATSLANAIEPTAISTTSKIANAASVALKLLPLVTLPLTIRAAEQHWAHRDYFESVLDITAGVGGAPGLALQLALTSSPAY